MALLEIEALRKEFGGLAAVDGLDFRLDEGEMHALIGPNGCVKSTLFDLISGAFPPTQGHVRFDGEDITGLSPHVIARRGIGRKFQVPAVFDELTVIENLSLPAWAGRGLALLAPGPRAGEALLERIGLTAKGATAAGALSHGERQWLEIGMLLNARARLLLLDEPTAGMTAAETAATAVLIRDIAAAEGLTVLLIEHDIGFIRDLDCPVTVMVKGRVLCSGTYDEVRADTRVRELYFGRAG